VQSVTRPRPARRITWAAALAVLPIALAAACSGAAEPSPTLAPAVTAAEVVARARDSTAALHSFRFLLSHESGHTALPGGIALTSAEGAAVAPGNLSFTAKATIGRAFVKIDAVLTGGNTYMTNPVTGTWSELPAEDSPFGTFDPPLLIATILGQVEHPSFAEPPSPGVDYAISARISAAAFASLVGQINPEYTVDVVLRVDPAGFHLKRVEATGRVADAEPEDVRRIIELSDFDASITIEPPV